MEDKAKAVIMFLGGIIAIALLAVVVLRVIRVSNNDPVAGVGLVKSDTSTKTNNIDIDLDKQSKNSTATLLVRGPVIAREDHYQIEMTINSTQRTIKVYEGYENKPTSESTLPNDEKAYEEFLYSTYHEGMFVDNATNLSGTGYCPDKQVRTYELSGGTTSLSRWANTCDRLGDISSDKDLYKLFSQQFANFENITEDIL